MSEKRKLCAIVFADIAGYTAMMQKDEELGLFHQSRFKEILEKFVPAHNGDIVQFFGDGCLLAFESSYQSVKCSKALQETFVDVEIPVRIGIHLGDVVFRDGNAFGDGVNVASRIESMGVPGAVMFSKPIRDHVVNKVGIEVKSVGSYKFKNVTDNMEVFALANKGFVVPTKSQMKGKLDPNANKGGFKPWMIAATLALLIGLAGVLYYLNQDSDKEGTSIAVLPFKNLSPLEEDKYFTEGMHDDLLTYISKIGSIRTISRNSVMKYENSLEEVPDIAGALSVSHILSGSLRRAGETIRLNVSLFQGSPEKGLWAQQFDYELIPSKIFEIQSAIGKEIAEQLKLNLTSAQQVSLEEKPTDNLKAYENYLRAKQLYRVRTGENLLECQRLLLEAVDLDDNFDEAHAMLGNVAVNLVFYAGADKEKAYEKGWSHVNKALEINPLSFEAYTAKGSMFRWGENNLDSATAAFEKAIEINPNYYPAYFGNAVAVTQLGRDYKKGADLTEKALRINPLDTKLLNLHGQFERENNRFKGSAETFRKGIELNPLDAYLWGNLSGNHYYLGRYDSVAIINHQAAEVIEMGGTIFQLNLEGLRELNAQTELEELLNKTVLSTYQDSSNYYQYKRDLALLKLDFDMAYIAGQDLKDYDSEYSGNSNFEFETAFLSGDYDKAINLFEAVDPLERTGNQMYTYGQWKTLRQMENYMFALRETGAVDKAEAFWLTSKELLLNDADDNDLYAKAYRKLVQGLDFLVQGEKDQGVEKIAEFFETGFFHELPFLQINPIFKQLDDHQGWQTLQQKYEDRLAKQREVYRAYVQ